MPPRLARLLAIVAAVALVGGAFALRGALSGDDDEGVASGPGSTEPAGDPDAPIRVICDEDLGDAACDAIKRLDGVDELKVMTASKALGEDALGAEDPQYDVWVTLDPWPQILDVAREVDDLGPVASDETIALATSAPAILANAAGTSCEDPVKWACLADEAAAGDDIGMASLDSAWGPLLLGDAAAGLLDTADFSIRDAQSDPTRSQLSGLLDSAPPGSLEDQARLVTRPGQYDALATTSGLAERTAATVQAGQQGLTVRSLGPEASIGVVMAPIGPNGAAAVDRLTEGATDQTVSDALAVAGWSGPPGPTTGLPAPDLLYALNEDFRR